MGKSGVLSESIFGIDQGGIKGPPTHLEGPLIVFLVGVLVVLVYHLGQSKNGFAQDTGFSHDTRNCPPWFQGTGPS